MKTSSFRNHPEKLEQLQQIWKSFPGTRPQPLGNVPSIGYGDRIGLATPGHIRTHQAADPLGQVAPLFAQQSAREMERLSRSPVEVMLDAVHALKESAAGFRWGADADHLKTEEQVAACVEAGFTFFTADPSDAISPLSEERSLEEQFQDLRERYPGKYEQVRERYACTALPGLKPFRDPIPPEILRVLLTYADAIQRIVDIFHWIEQRWQSDQPFDFEISVDETSFTTSPLAHYIIGRELLLNGIRWTSLAPKFPGEFQKGIEYEGDLDHFRADLKAHQSVCEQLGGYRLSVHSGSDKFRIYPILHEVCAGRVHLKTSGTSYLEALRVIASKAPGLFRKILLRASEVFEDQKASYHLTATMADFPGAEGLADEELEQCYLDSPLPRQVLHVSFGPILAPSSQGGFREAIKEVLSEESNHYAECLQDHLGRHFSAFGVPGSSGVALGSQE